MLYVFHGSDAQTSQKKASALVSSLREKRPDASYIRIEAGHWTPTVIEEHLGGQGLFSNKYIIFLDRVTENADAKEALPDFIPAMKESANIFIVLEGKILADLKKAVDAQAEKEVESAGAEGKKSASSSASAGKSSGGKSEFNIFALADAIGDRNRFKAWSVYRQAIDSGIEPENILGTLFWQAKSMALASGAKSAGEAGVSPFVFSKAKKAAGNYSAEELANLTKNFVTLYHDSHRGKVDAELGVERLLLTI
jgi:DNA polymerase III delta subunit